MVRASQHQWTAAEDELVLSREHTAAEIAHALQLTVAQVQGRRQRLRGTATRYTPRGPLRPKRGYGHWLIAKTCVGCGELVMRDGYIKRDGYHRERCRACHTAAGASYDDDRDEIRRAAQETSKRGAGRSGLEWTLQEMLTVSRPDLTIAQKAATLGRTHYAVTGMISKLRRGEVRLLK